MAVDVLWRLLQKGTKEGSGLAKSPLLDQRAGAPQRVAGGAQERNQPAML